MSSKDGIARSRGGSLQHDDGTVRQARFYYGDDEAAPHDNERIDPAAHATWVEDDGAIGIRRGTSSVSVGTSPAYVAKYDEIDWGN